MYISFSWASQVVLVVKNLPANTGGVETWVLSVGKEGLLEEEKVTHSKILAWKIPWTEEPGGLQSVGLVKVKVLVTKSWCLTLQSHGLQHARLPCPSLSPWVWSNSCPLSQWCHPAISSSVIPFSSCFQAFPASGSFPVSQLFTSGGQRIGASASAWVLPMNIPSNDFL